MTITNANSLSNKVVKSGWWALASKIISFSSFFIRSIVVARVLSPTDFGLFGICIFVLGMLEVFSESGITAALIQKNEGHENYLDIGWTVGILRGTFIAFLLFFGAYTVSVFFAVPAIVPLLKVLALNRFMQGFENIGVVYFQKDLKFYKKFWYDSIIAVTNLCVTVILAYMLKSVWALVFGTLAATIVSLIISYILSAYRPKIEFNKQKMGELFVFGRWIFGSGILVFVGTQLDGAFVGKVLGATMLGYYQMAYKFTNPVFTDLIGSILTVVYPAYSKIQNDKIKLKNAFNRVCHLVSSISILSLIMMMFFSRDFVLVVLGAKWEQAIVLINILAVAGFFRVISATAARVFLAIGKPSMDTKMQLYRVVILIVTIYPLSQLYGIAGIALSVVLGVSVTTFMLIYYIVKELNIKTSEFFQLYKGLAVCSAITTVTILMLNSINSDPKAQLLLNAPLSVIVFGIVAYYFDFELRKTINTLRNGFKIGSN